MRFINCYRVYTIIFLLVIWSVPSTANEDTPPSLKLLTLTKVKEVTRPTLSPKDCQKCHPHTVRQNLENGAAHKSKITCIDCHVGHPPMKRKIIPRCSQCHKDKPHFTLKRCDMCHTNPHTPLNITLTRDITFQCTTCHTRQIKELQENKSIHTTLDCTACHIRHGYVPKCFACHAPHLDTMSTEDCLGCHQAHMPLVVSYDSDTPSEFCGSCHTEVYQLLGKSHAKHRKVACVQCHVAKHKQIPVCQKCHKQPHPKSMLDNFSSCGVCHGIAHSLKLNQIDLSTEQKKRR